MENYLNRDQKSLSDTWILQDHPNYDPDLLLGTIMEKGASMEPIDYDPDSYYAGAAFWFRKWKRTFNDWLTALDIEYNPLENYDRKEDWTDTDENSGTDGTTRTTTEVTDGAKTHSNSFTSSETVDTDTSDFTTTSSTEVMDKDTSNDSTTENKTSAFDSAVYEEKDKSITNGTGTDDTTTTLSGTDNSTGTVDTTTATTSSESGSDTDDTTVTTTENISGTNGNSREGVHTGRIHGNIGVTTSQQMLKAELDLKYWNVYNHMADLFLHDMVVTIYS